MNEQTEGASPGHRPTFSRGISRRTEILLVVGLALLGLGLRLVGVSYGLPDFIYHPDTPKQLHRVRLFMHGALIPKDAYPTLHMYMVALLLKLLFLLDPHLVDVDPSFSQVAITARLLNAFLGAGIIPLVYAAGRWLFGWPVAALAAVLAALSPLHILHAHYEMGDIPQAFFVMASVAAAVRVFVAGRPAAFLLAGALAGLAASAKYYGVVVAGALVVGALTDARRPWRRTLGLLLLAGLTALGAFVLTTPKLLLTPLEFIGRVGGPGSGLFVLPPPPLVERPVVAAWILIGNSLDWFGALPLALAAFGASVVLPRLRGGALLLTTPALVFALYVIARSNFLDDRNLVILAPFVCLMASSALVWLKARGRLAAIAATVVGIAVLVSAAMESLNVAYLFWQDDTRLLAQRWAERYVPPSEKILRGEYETTVEAYQATNAALLVTDSGLYRRHVVWYAGRPSERVRRSLDFLAERGKLVKRFEISHRGFIDRTIAYFDLDSMAVPHAFPPPEDVAPPPERLMFVDGDAVPERLGVVVEPRQAARPTLVSRGPLGEIGVALSGEGGVRVRQGLTTVRVGLTPGRTHIVRLHPTRSFPWFRYFYPITVEAREGRVYARILPTACDLAQAFLADRRWTEAIATLKACQGAPWVEPARLLDLAWAHAQVGQVAEAERAIGELRRTSPGLLEALMELAGQPDGEGWRERYRLLTGHARWFWWRHTVTVQAEDVEVRVGRVINSEEAHGGKALSVGGGAGTAGYLNVWFAPDFLRGRYLVRFRLRQTTAGGAPAATLSVVRHFQDQVYDLAISREWAGTGRGRFEEVALPVVTELEPIRLEARVWYPGRGAIEIDEISIVPDVRAVLASKLDSLRSILDRRG